MPGYRIGKHLATDIAKKYGTPVYVYHKEKIVEQFQKLTKAFERIDHRIHYACKANESPDILRIMKELGAGVDTVSPNEIKQAIKVGFTKNDILFTPSCASISEIRDALELGIDVHLGGVEYLEMLGYELMGKEVGLRINPAIAIEGNQKISTSHVNSKFGIPLDQMGKLKSLIDQFGAIVTTLHIHTGSDVKSWMDLARSFDVLVEVAGEFDTVHTLDIGSGLKVKYSDKDNGVDLNAYASHIEGKLESLGRPMKIVIEPGKYLVAEAGILLTRVNVVKQGYVKKFVGVNSGFHHLIRPMYYDAYHHIINISNMNGERMLYDVVGQLCEEDTFAHDIPLSEVKTGDILVFQNAGAYAYAMSMTYNLWEKPMQVMVDGDEIALLSNEQIRV